MNTNNDMEPMAFEGALLAVVDKISSRASTGDMLLTLAIPLEKAAQLTPLLSKIGRHVGVAFADVDRKQSATPSFPGETSQRPAPKNVHQHGGFASLLYRHGFFLCPDVARALDLTPPADAKDVSAALAKVLGYESMGDVPPPSFFRWIIQHNLKWIVPSVLRDQLEAHCDAA